jgi:hypothetical protein
MYLHKKKKGSVMVIIGILKSILIGLAMILAVLLIVSGSLFFISLITGILGLEKVSQWANRQAKGLFQRTVNVFKFKSKKEES